MSFIELCNYWPWEYSKTIGIIAAIYGITLFVCYLYEIHKHFGWLKSISISYYKVREIFQMFMYAEAFSIILIAQNALYTVAAICFVIMAMFPSVLYKHFIIPHCIFASSAIILMSIGMPICCDLEAGALMLAVEIIGICMFWYSSKDNQFYKDTLTYWIEVWSLSLIIAELVISKLIV